MEGLVKYQNDMNRLSFRKFSQVDMNIFFMLCAQLKEKGSSEVVLTYSEIKKAIKFASNETEKEFINRIDDIGGNILDIKGKIRTSSSNIRFNLFRKFENNFIEKKLIVAVDEEYLWLLNEMTNYTTFELEEFVNLKSRYSKNLFRLLKQWRTQGRFIFYDLEEFRDLMDIPASYKNKTMMTNIIKPSIEEICEKEKSFKGLTCTPRYSESRRGRPLEALEFTWQAEISTFIPMETVEEEKKTQKKSSTKGKSPRKNFTERGEEISEEDKELIRKLSQREMPQKDT